MRCVVIDTNCLLRMIPTRSKYRQAWEAFLNGEITAILRNPCTRRYDPQYHFGLISQDADDNKFVDCAIIANADYIVSEDSHFKELNTIPFPQVRLLSLPQFMQDMGYHLNIVEP